MRRYYFEFRHGVEDRPGYSNHSAFIIYYAKGLMMTEKCPESFACENIPHWDQLGPIIKVGKGEEELNFTAARIIADAEATRLSADPMLLAWYEARSGEFSPRVEC
ncbi:MAG: AF1514 family protein [Syntrophobacteraceae bacterium]